MPHSAEFAAAREELRRLARDEQWSGVAAILGRLPKLAETDAELALAAQDLGVFHRSRGRRDEAAEAFGQALGYARLVAPPDPSLLAGALTDAGDIAMEARRADAAAPLYDELLTLRRQIADSEPTAENRRLLSLALERLADAREERGFRSKALALYEESLALSETLAAADPDTHGHDLGLTRERVAELRARLA